MKKTIKNTNNNTHTMATKTTAPAKMVKFKILDHNGDTNLQKKIEEAVAEVQAQVFGHGKWPYVNGEFFTFKATSVNDTAAFLEDAARLKRMLDETDEPFVVLTADLQGGI